MQSSNRLGRLTATLWAKFQAWEKSAQIGFALALFLIIPVFIAGNWGHEDLQTPAIIGVMGLIIVAQVIFMWANRNMVTPYTLAQRHYLCGEFEQACELLESLHNDDKADIYSLTLLGNTYRQLGDLGASKAILYEALNINPNHYFPLYGFGRTLLSEGHYAEAIDAIEKSIKHQAESVVYFDLAEALYFDGQIDSALRLLNKILPELVDEPHREFMARLWLYLAGQGEYPSQDVIDAGLPYWERLMMLFADTPYGQAIIQNIQQLKTKNM